MTVEPNRFVTDRGFTWYDTFIDTRNTVVAVYESSAADGDYLWVAIGEDGGGDDEAYPRNASSAHLDREQAERLAAAVTTWLAEHPS